MSRPEAFVDKKISIKGSMSFSNEFKATGDVWYMFSDGTDDILVYSKEKGLSGSGVLTGVVEETGTGQIYIKMENFG